MSYKMLVCVSEIIMTLANIVCMKICCFKRDKIEVSKENIILFI